MQGYWRRKLGEMIFFVCVMSMAACGLRDGKTKNESQGDESGVNYVMEYTEGSIQGEIRQFHFYGGMLYRLEQEGPISKLFRCGTDAENTREEMVFSLEKGENLLDFAVLSDGRIVAAILKRQGSAEDSAKTQNVILNKEETQDINLDKEKNRVDTGDNEKRQDTHVENAFALRLYDSGGVYLQDVAAPEMEGSYAFARLRTTAGDEIVLTLDSSACMLKDDGTVIWLNQGLGFLIMGVYVLEEGDVILTETSGQGMILNKIGVDGQVDRQVGTIPSFVRIVDSELGLYAVGTGCLYNLKETGNRIEVLSLATQGISDTTLEAVTKEGSSYAICIFDRGGGNTYQLARLQEKEGAIEKAVLTIALTDDFIARSPMGTFNVRSKTHRVVAKKYSDDSISARNAQIDASMLTDDAPDLLCMEGQERYENYAAKGALLDVTDLIPKEDYLERTINDFTVDGKLYGFPQSFSVQMLFCASEDLNGKTNWNLDEFMDFLEKHPTAFMDPEVTPEREKKIIFNISFTRGIYEFVDFDKGEAHFDTSEFRRYLSRIKGLNITAVTETKYERAQRGDTILWYDTIDNPPAMTRIAALIGQDKKFTLIGFPDGKNGSGGLLNYSAALGINRKTQGEDAAREFFGYWLETGNAWSKYHFPITKQGFEDVIERAKEVNYKKDDEGNLIYDEDGKPMEEGAYWGMKDPTVGLDIEYIVYALTDEQEKMLRDAVDKSIAYSHGERTIKTIVGEEVEPYLAGQIGLEETVDKIQRRVQLLLDEGK